MKVLVVVGHSSSPSQNPSRTLNSAPLAHLYWPRPLVVDLGPELLAGLSQADMDEHDQKASLRLCRAAWELIRLQKRFRGRVYLMSSFPSDVAMPAACQLGLERALLPPIDLEDPSIPARWVEAQFGSGGFDLIAGEALLKACGTLARRVWLIGESEPLQRRMLTCGVHLVSLDAGDRFAVTDLAERSSLPSEWSSESPATEAPSPMSHRLGRAG